MDEFTAKLWLEKGNNIHETINRAVEAELRRMMRDQKQFMLALAANAMTSYEVGVVEGLRRAHDSAVHVASTIEQVASKLEKDSQASVTTPTGTR